MLVLYTSLGLDSYNHTVYYTSLSGNSIRSRSYSVSINKTSYKIASTVEALYNMDPKGWESRGVLRSSMEKVKELLFLEKYVLSSIHKYAIDNDSTRITHSNPLVRINHYEFVALLQAEYRLGHSHLIDDQEKKALHIFKAGSPSDLLVYMALSKRLLSAIGCPQNVCTLEDLEPYHYDNILQCDNIVRLYKIDLSLSIIGVDKSRVLNSIMNRLCLSRMERTLIESFVNLAIMDIITDQKFSLKHIPVIGELTQVIFHIFFMEEFDSKIMKQYPSIPFYRLGTEVIIPIPKDYDYDECDIEALNLLEKINLFGTLSSMKSDTDQYITCTPHESNALTLNEHKIEMWGYEDF